MAYKTGRYINLKLHKEQSYALGTLFKRTYKPPLVFQL